MLGVLICLCLVLLSAFLSKIRKENLEKDFVVGALRTILQLVVLGLILDWIFKNSSISIVIGISLIMTLNAALQATSRVEVRYKGIYLDHFISILLAIWPLAFLGSSLMKSNPVWRAEIYLPLLGMLLGNTLNGISIGINFFGVELKTKRDEVFSLLALGATPKEATTHIRLRSIKLAMTPILNSMVSMGFVSIPGMMTGQILAGNSPMEAALIQIVIVLLITVSCYVGISLALTFSRRKKFSHEGVPCFE